LYNSLVRFYLEYANLVWNPYQIKFIKTLEKVQMKATKLISNLRNKLHEDRVRISKRLTIRYRRIRGDMTSSYAQKILLHWICRAVLRNWQCWISFDEGIHHMWIWRQTFNGSWCTSTTQVVVELHRAAGLKGLMSCSFK